MSEDLWIRFPLPHFIFTRKKKPADAPKKFRFEGNIRLWQTRRYLPRRSRACIAGRWSSVRKHPQASSRLIASIVLVLRSAQRDGGSSLCGIAIVSTPSFLLHQWSLSPLSPLLILDLRNPFSVFCRSHIAPQIRHGTYCLLERATDSMI